jgi:two-component system, NarL family, response regulator YdfI
VTRVLLVAPSRERLTALDALLQNDPQVKVVSRALAMSAILDHEGDADVVVAAIDNASSLRVLLLSAEDGDRRLPPLVVLSSPAPALAGDLLRLGARSILSPHAEARELTSAIEAVAAGLVAISPEAVAALADVRHRMTVSAPGATGAALSPREREVLALLAEGLGNKIVAVRLGISEHTVKTHVASIFEKLGADTRAEAVALGARTGALLL